jgi:hypothetical protein
MMRFWFAAILFVQSQISVQQVQPGTVTGRLLSSKGTAEVGVRVAAIPAAEATNKTGTAALVGISLTDSEGRYRLENLPPGRYYIFAGLIDLPSYYPNATTIDRATAIDVDEGTTLSGLDFSMARPSSLTVAGRMAVPPTMQVGNGWAVTLTPQSRLAVGASLQSNVSSDGSFEFPRVSPGAYRLASTLRGATALNLNVVDEDVLGVVIPLVDCNAGVAVSGRLAGTPRSVISSISLTGIPGRMRTVSASRTRWIFHVQQRSRRSISDSAEPRAPGLVHSAGYRRKDRPRKCGSAASDLHCHQGTRGC